MEKNTLEKIYRLRKIKPDNEWKERTKNNILEKDGSFDFSSSLDNVFAVIASAAKQSREVSLNSSAGLVVAFMVMVVFTIPIVNNNYERQYYNHYTYIEQTDDSDDEKMLAEKDEDDQFVEAEEPKPMEQELATIEDSYRELQLTILSSKTGKEEKEDIAKELIAEIEKKGAEEMISMLGAEDDSEEEALQQMKEAFEEDDYNKVFDIYLEEL